MQRHFLIGCSTSNSWLQALSHPAIELRLSPLACGGHVVARDWHADRRCPNAHILHLVLAGTWQGGSDPASMRSCGPGHLIWSMPGVVYASRWRQGYRYANATFTLIEAGHQLRLADDLVILGGLMDLRPHLDRLACELRVPQAFRDEQVRSLLVSLFVQIFRHRQQRRGSGLSRQQLHHLESLIDCGIGQLSAEQLADGLSVSRGHCGRLFRRHFGFGPRQWLAQQRLAQACRLLSDTSLSIEQLAEQLGYASANSFSRRFAKAMGLAPTHYRQRHR